MVVIFFLVHAALCNIQYAHRLHGPDRRLPSLSSGLHYLYHILIRGEDINTSHRFEDDFCGQGSQIALDGNKERVTSRYSILGFIKSS